MASNSLTLRESLTVALDYLRASALRAQGARVGPKVRIGAGCNITRPKGVHTGTRVVIEPQAVLKLVGARSGVALGDHVFIGRGTLFDLSDVLSIGQGTMLAPFCFITDHNHGIASSIPMWQQPTVCAPVRIGADCWLGARVTVLPGVTIGDGAVVAAGAVVTHDVAPGTIVGGVPARFLRTRA
jgi:acetyltransferase-like isoleucine patch superfamily enzyme